jgi:hypothetical protein
MFFFAFVITSCKAQNTISKQNSLTAKKDTMSIKNIPVIDNFEQIDINNLQIKGRKEENGNENNPTYYLIIQNTDYYQLFGGDKIGGYNEVLFPNNSYFMLEKTFYSNGNIKEKGLRDADNDFRKENIRIPQGHRRVGGWQTIIERSTFSTLDDCVWRLECLKGNYTNQKDNIEVLAINGTTGEVVKKSYQSFSY